MSLLRMWCSAWADVSCGVLVAWIFCGRGAALVAARETQRLPSPKGQQPASRRTGHSVPTSQAPMQKGVPDLWSYPPFGFCGSRRQWVVNPRTRVSGALAVEDNQPSRRLVLLEPETTAGQPAPVSTKAPGTRDHCRATGPRVCKSSLTWIHQGQPAHELGTGLSARDRTGQPAPASTKAVPKLDHLGTTSPTVIQISPFSKEKTDLPFKACTA